MKLKSDHITTSVVARILGKAEGTVRLMADRGELPSVRTSTGTRLFDRGAVERAARGLTPKKDAELCAG